MGRFELFTGCCEALWGSVGHLWGAVGYCRAPWVAYGALWGCPTGAPCLSLDIVRDTLGDDRETLPLSLLLCAGTQAATAQGNRWGAP